MNKTSLLLLLVFHSVTFAQNRASVYREVENLISKGDNFFKNVETKFDPDELIGHIISEEAEGEYLEDKIYFVNNKYYLKISQTQHKTLGIYKFKTIQNIPLIILLGKNGEQDTHYEGIVLKKTNQKYSVNWNHSNNYTYNLTAPPAKNKPFLVDDEVVKELNFDNPHINFYLLNAKIGIKLKDEKIIPDIADSLQIYGKIATIFHSGNTSIYNLTGKLICKNIKDVYPYSTNCHQIIDSKNNMFFIDTLGNKHHKPIETRNLWGNDTDAQKTVTYYTHKDKILKVTHQSYNLTKYQEPSITNPSSSTEHLLYLLQQDVLTLDNDKKTLTIKEIESIIQEKNYQDLFFLKKIFKEEKYLEEISYYLLSDFTTQLIQLPKGVKKVKFINNSHSEISAEDYWYYIGFYKPLKPSYIIAKKSGKFGVWDIEENKSIIPFHYKNIDPKNSTHLLLEKNGLSTYYPNIGSTPKYKYLSNYNEYYARFEYPNGAKGWVNRKGIEYYDPTN